MITEEQRSEWEAHCRKNLPGFVFLALTYGHLSAHFDDGRIILFEEPTPKRTWTQRVAIWLSSNWYAVRRWVARNILLLGDD